MLQGHTGKVRAVAFSPDGKTLASASDDFTVRLVVVSQMRIVLSSEVEATVLPSGEKATARTQPECPFISDVNTGFTYRMLQGHTGKVRAVAFSPDGKTLASVAKNRPVGENLTERTQLEWPLSFAAPRWRPVLDAAGPHW
jgi:WD40 repeat protein